MWKKSSVLSEASFSRYDKPLKRDGKHSLISSYSLKSKEHEKVIQKLKLYEFYANGLAKISSTFKFLWPWVRSSQSKTKAGEAENPFDV